MKVIHVKKCAFEECPYFRDALAKTIAYCVHSKVSKFSARTGWRWKRIHKVKSFPKCCPLKDAEE